MEVEVFDYGNTVGFEILLIRRRRRKRNTSPKPFSLRRVVEEVRKRSADTISGPSIPRLR